MATKAAGKKLQRTAPPGKLPDTTDPIEIAMIAAASGKPLPDAALNVLEKHARLIDAQCSELKLRQIGEGVRAALWATMAIAAFAVVALLVTVIIRASRSDALIVQSFRVPPALESRGLTGEVVATQVLDRLAEMQEATESTRAASTYANNWEDELKIDIPNTGATTDQVWKLLRSWLGKETRISGEVIDTGGGLALTARVGSKPGQQFVSEKGDVSALVAQGSELIFKRTQPYRHAVYLGVTGRTAERYGLLLALTSDPSPVERKWAYSGLSYDRRAQGQFEEASAMASRALEIDPEMTPAIANKGIAESLLGHEQAAIDLWARSLKLEDTDELDPEIDRSNRCSTLFSLARSTNNPDGMDEAAKCMQGSRASFSQYVSYNRAIAELMRGNVTPALSYRSPPNAAFDSVEAAYYSSHLRLFAEMIRGQSPALAQAIANFAAAATATNNEPYGRAAAPTTDWPLLADALSIDGRHADAQTLIDRTPLDCYGCLHVRGMIAMRSGDRSSAQRWFSSAIKLGPRLPKSYVGMGRLLLENGQYAGAESHLRKAAQLAPRWGEPLKYWGDVLAAKRSRTEALRKYDAALKFSPRWVELQQARARTWAAR